MQPSHRRLLALAPLLLACGLARAADDWPEWRGPQRDGISRESGWAPNGARENLWERAVDLGYSAVSVADGRLFTPGHDVEAGLDALWCLQPETGAVLPDGEMGELVFTTLTKEGLPIIRYRTRDLTRLLPGTARTMRRMEKITGRSDDMIILRGVNVFPTQIEEQVLRTTGLAPHFQIELVTAGRMDAMKVHVEPLPEAADAPARAAQAAELARHIRDVAGVSAEVVVSDPGGVARSEGKARRVVDNRTRG